ncbi:hypothetical protein G6K93_05660 [Agrobacterium rhizogenes]|nr:hypothetical protein [Rhizobium rhizogenes]NTJ46499.1 hypothetical protein [Rhizobium rhizogenes]
MDGEEELVRLLTSDGTWKAFAEDWEKQCEPYEEDFSHYAEATFSVVRDIIETEQGNAGVFALRIKGKHVAMCQANRAMLPRYDGPVLRVRFITLSPELDLGDADLQEYGAILVSLLTQIIGLSLLDDKLKSKYIKFHLRSPADRPFFSALGKGLHEANFFETVAMQGMWLYISHK